MKIERFEDIEAWQLSRELTRKIYALTKKAEFARDFGLKGQIQEVYDHAARTRAAIRGFTRLPCETCEHMERTSYWSCSAHT
jgi:hypothetical protein